MRTKERDIVFQRWSGAILRETRDVASLEQVCARALADPDVRDDATLQSMIRSEVQQRRIKLERELQAKRPAKARPTDHRETASAPPPPTSAATVDELRSTLSRLSGTLSASLERSNENETAAAMAQLRALQEANPGVIPAASVAAYEQRVGELRDHLHQLREQVETLVQQAVAASRAGSEQNLARAMRRLLAIHAAHPTLLDEKRLDVIRAAVADAAEARHQHQATTRKLLERERAIAADLRGLAAAVHQFHRVACTMPSTSAAFHEAEAAYIRTIQQVRACDTEWFSGVVLELADLLAEWTLPPLEAEGQVDRFLDGITAGLESIRAEMQVIESEQDSDGGEARTPAAP